MRVRRADALRRELRAGKYVETEETVSDPVEGGALWRPSTLRADAIGAVTYGLRAMGLVEIMVDNVGTAAGIANWVTAARMRPSFHAAAPQLCVAPSPCTGQRRGVDHHRVCS